MRNKKRTRPDDSEVLNKTVPSLSSRFSSKTDLFTKSLVSNSNRSFTNNNHITASPLCYDEKNNEFIQAPKRLALQDYNVIRYEKEFCQMKELGVGEFGVVHLCLNRLDGCFYAIKRSIKPIAGCAYE